MIGQTVSHYKIIEKLGSGGMGVVYKAQDIKLDRFVALKFLPQNLNQAEEEKQRFIHEAKAASALDHNNICTIHEIDEAADGQLFIAMALYEGQTLDQKIEAGPVKLDEAVDITVQISEGLAKAHGKDIVHRDLKPANVMLTEDGVVKILDFGLAKLRGQTKLTKEGTTLGTAAYMSPEQAQGQEVDQRTDIFSLGVLIYEMVTGQQPFKGDYEQAVTYSILHEDPEPITGLRTGVPLDLERAVLKCLEKASDERYQSATDLLVDLKRLSRGLHVNRSKSVATAPSAVTEGKKASTKSKRGMYALGAIGIAGLIALVIYFQRDAKPVRLTNPRKITQAIGRESLPTWSPDGTRIAYVSDQTGRADIWIKQLAGGEALNMTKEMADACGRPSWSPDGSQIAFISDGSAIWVMPAIGGAATRVTSTWGTSTPVWSADGTRLAHVVKDSAGVPRAEIYTLSTHKKSTVTLPGTEFERTIRSWSPQGDYFAYTDGTIQTSGFLRIVRLADGTSVQINPEDRSVRSAHWSADGRLLYFSSNHGGTPDLWRAKLDARGAVDSKPQQISTGLGMDNFSFSTDHTKIAYTRGETSSNLWRVAIPKPNAPAAQWTSAKQLTFESSTVWGLDVSPDGKRIYFSSTRSGNDDIWSMAADGSEIRQLTTHPGEDDGPIFSPDGRTLAFRSDRSGKMDIWTMPATGGASKQLTNGPFHKWSARWSPDGQTLAYIAQKGIWLVPAQGGEAMQVITTDQDIFSLLWWPDGQSLVTVGSKSGGIMRFAIPGGRPKLLTKPDIAGIEPDDLRWSADEKNIYFIRELAGARNIWSLSVADGSVRQQTDFSGRPGILGRSFGTDGTYFYFKWKETTGDIWVMDLERED